VVNVPVLDPAETVPVQAVIDPLDRSALTVWVHVDPQEAVAKVAAPSILGKAGLDASTVWPSIQTILRQSSPLPLVEVCGTP
jgi:hypothetical protein